MPLRRGALLASGLLVAVLGGAGCLYTSGSVSYAQSPELRTVRLYTGKPDPEGESLGAVEVIRRGYRNCSELGTEALVALLGEAKALGGTGVKDVKFRGRFHWTGRVVCRSSISGRSVQVRGIATR